LASWLRDRDSGYRLGTHDRTREVDDHRAFAALLAERKTPAAQPEERVSVGL
jgi:hypothetical protein